MTVATLVRSELRRLTATRMGVVALVALGVVPVLYGGLYLWGNQDPYGNLKDIPVALVNADTGARVDGITEHYGASTAEDLVSAGDFDWRAMSAAAASTAVRDGDVDFVVTLPADFSRDIASVSTATPSKARIEVTSSDANNALSTRIAASASEGIRASITQQVDTAAAERFLVSIAGIKSDLTSAASSAKTLANGANATSKGAAQVASGSASLASGLSTAKSTTASLPRRTRRLASGATSVSDGAQRVGSASAALAAGLATIDSGSAATATAVQRELAADGLSAAQIARVLGTLQPGATAIHSASTSAASLAHGASAVASGASNVASGTDSLAAGSAALSTGIARAAGGALEVASASSKVAAGTAKVAAGATKLHHALSRGASTIPSTTGVERTAQAAAIGDPASVVTTNIAPAGTYGAGLAPFFLSLSTWIGSYALFLIIRPLSGRAITAVRRPVRVTLAGWLVPAALGVVQVAALLVIVAGPLGFTVADPLATFGVLALTAVTFAAILLALNAALGSVGQFLGLILMLVQLVTAGGTFPWQTLPAPLAALHHALPMSYAVDALRQTMYGGTLSLAFSDALVLGLWLVAALGLTVAITARMTARRTMRDLQPSLIGA